MFRHYLIYCIALLSLSVSCSKNTSDIEIQKQKTVRTVKQINWMSHWYQRDGKEDLIRQIAREYELQHQNLSVNLKFIQEVYQTKTDDRRKFNNEVVDMIKTGHVTWDILVLDNPSYDSIANKLKDKNWGAKYLVNFEEFDWFRNHHKSFLFEGSQYRRNTGGIIPGPLIEGVYLALWFNGKVAENLRLEVKKTGMTYGDLKEYFRKAYEYNQTHQDKVILLYDDGQAHPAKVLLNALVISEMGQIDPAQVDRAKGLAALKKGLDALQELSKYQPITHVTDQNLDDLMLNEKILSYIKETWVYNRWARVNKNKAAAIFPSELPVFEKPGIYYPGTYQSVYAVLKQSPNEKEAIDIMKYICSNDVAERWTRLTRNPTGLIAKINATDFGVDDFTHFNNEINRKYGKNIQTIYLSELLFGQKNSTIDIDPITVLEGRTTSEDYYNQIRRQLR